MKAIKMVSRAEKYIDTDKRKRKEKRKCLKHVLSKLRKYEKKLEHKLQDETSSEKIKRLEKRIKLAHAQRKKALKLMEGLMDKNSKD
jgi:predicted RecB family nuclease